VTTLGVTGGIGSGKSTACRMLEEQGARVFYADAEAKRLMQEDDALQTAIAETFGADTYDAEGTLNRARLAAVVFSDEEKLQQLNALVHPKVFEAFGQAKEQAEAEGVELLVHEAALIFESGGDAHLDAVAVVDAPVDVRIRRVTARDGASEAEVRARMSHQLPPAELRQRADYVLDNSGSTAELRRQVHALYAQVSGPDASR
jgi:dephospho-CoA kinase